jgi:hypothetical protein
MDFHIADKTGEWVAGCAPLGLRDPTTQVFLPFGKPVKITLNAWIKGQMEAGTVKVCEDPLASTPVVTSAKVK